MSDKLTHFDPQGASRMVDVGSKAATRRVAVASGRLRMQTSTQKLLAERRNAKGDALEVARVAGIMAAKRTSDLVPLCHPIMLTKVTIDYEFPAADSLLITCTAETTGQTGVEMEALTAVSVAALTVYDMGKAVDRGIEIGPIRLEEKQGGKSGHWRRRESSGDETTTEANAL